MGPSTATAEQDLADYVATVSADLDRLTAAASPQLASFASSAQKSLLALPPAADSAPLADLYYKIARFHFLSASSRAGLVASDAGLCVSRRIGDVSRIANALLLDGTLKADLMDVPGAYLAYGDAMGFIEQLGDRLLYARWLNQIGRFKLAAGSVVDARVAFEQLLALADTDESLGGARLFALTNIAVAMHAARDFDRGIAACNEALEIADRDANVDPISRIALHAVLCRNLLGVGKVAAARQHADTAVAIASKSGVDRGLINAQAALGLVEVHENIPDVGLTRLRQVLDRSRRSVQSLLAMSLHVLVTAYEQASQPTVAMVYLHELSDLKRKQRLASIPTASSTDVDGSDDLMAEHQATLSKRASFIDAETLGPLLERQAAAAELHDDTTGVHCYRVGRLAALLAAEVGMDPSVCRLVDLAARLHDIGKLSTPDAILQKPGPLTATERLLMERHTTDGQAILQSYGFLPQIDLAQEIALYHHERHNGSGYPKGLSGSAIPLSARIAMLADVFDALTHSRPYKKSWTVDDALAHLESNAGVLYDPDMTPVFIQMILRLRVEQPDLDAYLAAESVNDPFVISRNKVNAALRAGPAPWKNPPTRS